jgi:hypothetical protein
MHFSAHVWHHYDIYEAKADLSSESFYMIMAVSQKEP